MYALFGLIAWAPAGAIVALPVKHLNVSNRAVGMGVFFSYYYVGTGVLSLVAGWLRDITGKAEAPILFAGLLFFIGLVFLAWLRVAERSAPTPSS